VLLAVGGAVYPPRGGRLERLAEELRAGLEATRTLGGCQLIPRAGRLLVVREWETVEPVTLAPGGRAVVDGRFEAALPADAPGSVTFGPLGRDGWAQLTLADAALKDISLPGPVRPALMAVRDAGGLVSLPDRPHLPGTGPSPLAHWRFAPRRALTGAGFTVAQDEAHIMS
jgi:tRNA(Ile)-lysidine synthase